MQQPELKRMATEGAGPQKKPSKKYKPQRVPLVIQVTSTCLHHSELHKIIVSRLEDGCAYKILMTGHAPWTVRKEDDALRALNVASVSIAGTILALVDNGVNNEIWTDLKVSFRFGSTGCSVGNICWPIDDVRANDVTSHIGFVLGLMSDIYNV